MLAVGTVVMGLGFIVLGFANGFYVLILFLFLTALGSATQHPLSSALVAGAYANGARRTALGTYNFAGDIGKERLINISHSGSAMAGYVVTVWYWER